MATDILTTLAEFLCWNSQQCMQVFNQYAYKPPLEGLLYFVFFPTVFLVLLIYLIANHVSGPHPKFSILLGIAFYAFVIVQGWYGFIASFGQFWYVLVIILVGIWAVFRTFFPGGGGGGAPRGRITTFGNLGKAIGGRMWSNVSGQERDLTKRIERELEILKKMNPDDYAFGRIMADTHADLSRLREMESVYGLKVAGEHHRRLGAEFSRIAKDKETH